MKNLLFFLLIMVQTARAGEVDTLDIYSNSMQKMVRTVVVTPFSYAQNEAALPVIYLLHGWSGNYADWIFDAPKLVDMVDENNLILVCPDGGYDSWWLDSPVNSKIKYETFLANELPEFMDSHFNTIQHARGRAIAGLSMGGHGALLNGLRNPTVFGAVGSMSGGVDLRPWRQNNWNLKNVLGDPMRFWDNWERNSVVKMVETTPATQQQIIIDCGTDDFFVEMNRNLHKTMLAQKIPHEYTERPGEHNAEYWSNAVDFQILFFVKFFKA